MDENQKFVLSSNMLSYNENAALPEWDTYIARKNAMQRKWADRLHGRDIMDVVS